MLLNITLILFLLGGCKTAEDLRRERLLDELSSKMGDSEKSIGQSQKFSGQMTQNLQHLQNQINDLHGRMEESSHQQKEQDGKISDQSNQAKEKIDLLEKTLNQHKDQIQQLQNSIKELNQYIKKVLESLQNYKSKAKKGAAMGPSSSSSLSSAAASPKKLYDEGMKLFISGQNAQAKDVLLKVLENPKGLSAENINRVHHNLGMIEFHQGNYEQAMVFLSKVYAQHPDSQYAGSSLLYIGKSLQKTKNIPEAKEAFQTVLKKYPKSKGATEAQKILGQLP